jgi:hypothetical protein
MPLYKMPLYKILLYEMPLYNSVCENKKLLKAVGNKAQLITKSVFADFGPQVT